MAIDCMAKDRVAKLAMYCGTMCCMTRWVDERLARRKKAGWTEK